MAESSGRATARSRDPLGWGMSWAGALVLMAAAPSWAAQTPIRERVSFNADWRFAKGDPNGAADRLSYANIRAWVLATGVAFTKDPNLAGKKRPAGNLGADVAYTQPGFDDTSWRSVTLPHDWGIEGPFDPKAPGGTGKLPFFGIRTLKFDPHAGFFINGRHIQLNGVNNHHDLGALGAAVNYRALQRQLEMLVDMGCNAIRTSHNPPAPELLELTDKMGLLVMDEAFDVWVRRKTPRDFHLIFPDWGEQDLRALVRRDRNCPSVILWSIGNEVGEQLTGDSGAALAKKLSDIVHDEDPTRPTTAAMNVAKPTSRFAAAVDVVSLNYQGAGIRSVPGQFPAFHQALPDKFIVSSETAAALSSRGEYLFPVAAGLGGPAGPNFGEDRANHHVSAYELYHAAFGASVDKVLASQEQHPYVGGEFVWTGWDYLGEPTPFYSSRSSYFGIIDLAGFRKDRFYLYQAHWRPDFPMAHILPHWTWPERVGQITPVHVFTSGDEAELFLNGKSLGKRTKGPYEYRLRWDEVTYEPGELRVVAYKKGQEWATDVMKTAGPAAGLLAQADRTTIAADGRDLSFVTVTVVDRDGVLVPRSRNRIRFSIDGPGEIVATDNGDPTSFESFQSKERNVFNGLCLAIVRAQPGVTGTIILKAESEGLTEVAVALRSEAPPTPSAAAQSQGPTAAPAALPASNR